jgi:hypothetical protein
MLRKTMFVFLRSIKALFAKRYGALDNILRGSQYGSGPILQI